MRKQTMLLMLSGTLVCVLLISGCVSNPPVKTNIRDILAKAKDIGPFTYDSITTTQMSGVNTNLTRHIWEESPYMKVNITGGSNYTVFIKRPDGVYVNIHGTNKFTRINSTFPEPSLLEESNKLLTNISYRVVGNETIEGHAATILQYGEKQSGSSVTTKVWIWNDKGVPLETQITIVLGTETVITKTVNANFVFGSIPLSEFAVS
jgi:outer membrane lipoprotein-sorting protein